MNHDSTSDSTATYLRDPVIHYLRNAKPYERPQSVTTKRVSYLLTSRLADALPQVARDSIRV